MGLHSSLDLLNTYVIDRQMCSPICNSHQVTREWRSGRCWPNVMHATVTFWSATYVCINLIPPVSYFVTKLGQNPDNHQLSERHNSQMARNLDTRTILSKRTMKQSSELGGNIIMIDYLVCNTITLLRVLTWVLDIALVVFEKKFFLWFLLLHLLFWK